MTYEIEDFHVGDVVVIREWDDMLLDFGIIDGNIPTKSCDWYYEIDFADQMRYLCGTIHTIAEIRDNGEVSFCDDECSVVYGLDGWTITTAMIEPYQRSCPTEITVFIDDII